MAFISSKPARLHPRQSSEQKSQYLEPFNTVYAHPGLRPPRSELPTTSPSKHDQAPAAQPVVSRTNKPSRSPLPAVDRPPETYSPAQFGQLVRKPAPNPKEPSKSSQPPPTRSRTVSGSVPETGSTSKLAPPSQWHGSPASRSHLNTHRASSTPSPSKHSGDISDGSTAISVDLKNLWSKPARPSTSGSIISVTSESDCQYPSTNDSYLDMSSGASPPGRTLEDGHEKCAKSSKPPTRLQESLGVKGRQFDSPPKVLGHPSTGQSLDSSARSALPVTSRDPRSLKERRALKRRPSGGTATQPAVSAAAAATLTANTLNFRPTTLDLTLNSGLRPPHHLGVPSQSNSSQSSINSKDSHGSPSALTPAGAVAKAYKQLEQRREDLTLVSQEIDHKARGGGESEVGCHTPYYTVLGSTTGKLVAIGGPEDDAWNLNIDSYTSPDDRPRATKSTPLRTLSRKASGKWKKVIGGGSVEVTVDPGTPNNPAGGSAVWPSLQEKPLTSANKENDRSVGAAIEKTIDAPSDPAGARSTPAGEDRARPSAGEPSGGGRLWRLVKRISAGALRDKFVEAAPPPVPAIPKDVIRKGPMSAPILSRASTSTKSLSGPRPSMTARSSSPVSSDVASSKFFIKTQSVRSSASSYDEKPPHIPVLVGQHIVPPSELYRLNQDHEDHIMMSPEIRVPKPPLSSRLDDWFVRSPDEERPSLPLPPPRRHGDNHKVSGPWRRPYSPAIPVFSTVDPVNDFHTIKSPPSGVGKPHGARPSLTVVTSPVPAQNKFPTAAHRPSARRPSEAGNFEKQADSRTPDTCRHSNTSTVRPSPPTNSPIDARSTSKRAPLTFRELGAAGTNALTEQQKADKWNDLLERSARAGGTLHLRGADLEARLSNYSADS